MRKFNTWFAKYSSVVVIMLVFAVAGCVTAGVWCYVARAVSASEAAVGEAYRHDKDLAQKMLFYITASDNTSGNQERFQEAVKEFGYTKDVCKRIIIARTSTGIMWFALAVMMTMLLIVVVVGHQRYVRKHVDDERQSIKEELKKSQAVEQTYMEKNKSQIQNYLENVAHQTRTPLTNVMLSIDSIYDEQSTENKRILDECNYHIERVNKLMTRFLKMGRLEAGEVVMEKLPENVSELLHDVVSALQEKERINLKLQEVYISMDRQWMYEAFACLIENSLENSVKICAETAQDAIAQANVDVKLVVEDDMVVVTVRDYGKGFNEEDIEHIFERFYTKDAKKATGHYGIGLNLAKLIIEAHYGVVKAYNAEDGGAVFRVALPQLNLKNGKMSP